MVRLTETEAEVQAILTSLRIARTKLERSIEDAQGEARRVLRDQYVRLDNVIRELERL